MRPKIPFSFVIPALSLLQNHQKHIRSQGIRPTNSRHCDAQTAAHGPRLVSHCSVSSSNRVRARPARPPISCAGIGNVPSSIHADLRSAGARVSKLVSISSCSSLNLLRKNHRYGTRPTLGPINGPDNKDGCTRVECLSLGLPYPSIGNLGSEQLDKEQRYIQVVVCCQQRWTLNFCVSRPERVRVRVGVQRGCGSQVWPGSGLHRRWEARQASLPNQPGRSGMRWKPRKNAGETAEGSRPTRVRDPFGGQVAAVWVVHCCSLWFCG